MEFYSEEEVVGMVDYFRVVHRPARRGRREYDVRPGARSTFVSCNDVKHVRRADLTVTVSVGCPTSGVFEAVILYLEI